MATLCILSTIIFLTCMPLTSCLITCKYCYTLLYLGTESPSITMTTTSPMRIHIPYIIKNGNLIPVYLPIPSTTTIHLTTTTPIQYQQSHHHLYADIQSNTTIVTDNSILCLQPGEQCNSELTCCENTGCKYNFDNHTLSSNGICCIMNGKAGCLINSDCCSVSDVCIDFVCGAANDTRDDGIYVDPIIISNNISDINQINVKPALFPMQFFFVLIFIPLLIMGLFGLCYKVYADRNMQRAKIKRKENDKNINKKQRVDLEARGGGIGIGLYHGYLGNDTDLGDCDLYDDHESTDNNSSEIDSDETPIPESFSMKNYLL